MPIVISLILLIAGIGVLIVIHVCIVGRAFGRGLQENNHGILERGSLASTSMSRDDIERLPSFAYRDDKQEKKSGGDAPADCAVCLENLKVGDKCRLLPQCKHSFHADCVDVWLLKTPRCPICRTSAEKSSRALNFDPETGLESEFSTQDRDHQATQSVQPTENTPVESSESQAGAAEDGHQDQVAVEVEESHQNRVQSGVGWPEMNH